MNDLTGKPLSKEEIGAALASLPGWSFERESISREFQFGSFREAMGFIVRMAFEAESLNHHPEMTNVYSTVGITLRTHDAGNTVTDYDIQMAERLNQISWI